MSEQYSVHLLLIFFSFVSIFPSLSCMLLVFGSLFFVRLLTISNVLLLMFLLIFYFATLLFNPVFLASLQAPLYCVINLSVLSTTFSGALVFLQLSPFIAHF